MSAIRPQTAPKRRPMTAQQTRPLGRVTAPLRRQVAEHGSNPESVIAAIKADLFGVQRRIDDIRNIDRTSSEMEFLERHLITMCATPGDDQSTTETINSLLEMLTQRFNTLATAALTACDEDTTHIPVGRTGGVAALADFVRSIADRKKLWDAQAPSLRDAAWQTDAEAAQPRNAASPETSHRRGRTSLDDALNEPTVSQLKKLIADQRSLQQQLHTALDQNSRVAQQAKEEQLRANHEADQARRASEKALQECTKQRDALQRRVTDLQLEVKKLHDNHHAAPAAAHHHHTTNASADVDTSGVDEGAVVQMAAGRLSFSDVPNDVLERAGVDTSKLVIPSVPDADQVVARVSSVLQDIMSGIGAETTTQKSKSKSKASLQDGTPNTEGVLWWMLAAQSGALEKVASYADETHKKLADIESGSSREVARLNRVISALNERVNSVKAAAIRDAERCRTGVSRAATSNFAKTSNVASAATAGATSRPIVAVAGQCRTAAEREKELRAQLAHQAQCIRDLQEQIATTKQDLQDEQRRGAANARENAQLQQRAHGSQSKVTETQQSVAMLEQEVQSLRVAHQGTKKELREKTASEAELQQTKWKLEVELHIAQNVISELRQREDNLGDEAKEASQCQTIMSTKLEEERRERAIEVAELKSQLHEARTEAEVSRQVLQSERNKMLEHEREVDRLRSLDLQMDVLEQNFTNYAACKLAQREAVEEEERVLQGCVDNIGRDVFVLPSGNDSEERVSLYLEKLRASKAAYDAEERTRKRQKATAVNWKDDRSGRKQLAQTMQQRYNAIQIFACEQRLRQITLERNNADLQAELDESTDRQEALTMELSHAKAQCDVLVQRNTELELQRKDFARGRVVAEQEIKTLKNTIHKMRIANEEQEKVLIDVGTRLQQAKGKEGGAALSAM